MASTAVRELRTPARLQAPPRPAAPRRASGRLRFACGGLLVLLAMGGLVQLRHIWPAEAALVVLLLVVPGWLLLRAIGTPGEAVVATPVYLPAASLIVLLAAGLGVDLAGPPLGVPEPLRMWPMLVGVGAGCMLLLAVGLVWRPDRVSLPWRTLDVRVWRLWPLALPLVAGAGALRLTNGDGNALALGALVTAGVLLIGAFAIAPRVGRSQLSLILYGTSLALAWSFALRGYLVYGWDITAEFHVATSTWAHGIWHTSHPHDAYGAMLSLTILPSALHALTGLPTLVLLKVIYPALVALFPVGIFQLASRHLPKRYAFAAAAFVVVQSYFFQQMPAIARQEIGLVLFVVLVAAISDFRMPRSAQVPLVALLALGVVGSHYTTSYLAAGFLGVAVLIQLVVSTFRNVPAVTAAVLTAFVFALGGAIVWNGPVTHSSSNVSGFKEKFQQYGFDFLPNAKPGQGLINSYLSGNVSRRISAHQYERLTADRYARQRAYVKPLPSSRAQRYALRDAHVSTPPVSSHRGETAAEDTQLLASQLFNVLAVLGSFGLVLRRRGSPHLRMLGILALSTLVVLAFLRLSGTAAASYNQERAFLQTMVALSVGAAFLLGWLERSRRWLIRALPVAFTVVALAVLLAGNAGLRGQLLGGGTPANLSNGGEDYERFVVAQPELSGARWLSVVPHGDLLYADTYGQLRVLAMLGRTQGLLVDTTPETLDQHAWVYASRTNVLTGHARGTTQDNRYSVFEWPSGYLDHEYNTVYSNGSSTVYHR